jgi:tRNA (cytidine32/uridine32-2'-O)-methyltransferase
MLSNIRVVLIGTSHPGNIGAAARAMKTMGLTQLYLVSPVIFPHEKALEMAAGATDLVLQAVVTDTLDEAIADCQLVVGASARSRTIPWPMLSPREFAEKVQSEDKSKTIAVLFGREQSGLTNEELHRCHYHLHIPSHPDYYSLNLAAAVQVIAYELRVAGLALQPPAILPVDYPAATADDLQQFYVHLEEILIAINFLNPKAPRQLMTRLRRLFNRVHMDEMEINIFRGILKAIGKSLPRK